MIRVKKPFEEIDSITSKQTNIIKNIKEIKENPENEYKPVVEAEQEQSEEFHGGDESTQSLPNTPNPSNSSEPSKPESESSESKLEESEGLEESEDSEKYEEFEDNGDYNSEQAFDLLEYQDTVKYYQTEFWRFLENFAEYKIKLFTNKDNEEYNIKKLMLRQYEKKSLNAYKQSRVRDSVILILDNSGSMTWWTENLRILARLAMQREDIIIFIAPNGTIEYLLNKSIYVNHDKVLQSLVNRKIIYVGDFDGANTPIVLSWANQVIWVCPENRYRYFRSHDWVSYTEKDFKGVFIRAYDLDEMFLGLRKISRFYNLWLDFHEDDKFEDDDS